MDDEKRKLGDYFRTGLFIIAMFLALIATFQFYFSGAGGDRDMILSTSTSRSLERSSVSLYSAHIYIYLTRSHIISRR